MVDRHEYPEDSSAEKSYRRGVHQALAMLDHFIHEYLDVDPASALGIASSSARTFRYDRRKHTFLMDEILSDVAKRLDVQRTRKPTASSGEKAP